MSKLPIAEKDTKRKCDRFIPHGYFGKCRNVVVTEIIINGMHIN